jgi:hypothetical protein
MATGELVGYPMPISAASARNPQTCATPDSSTRRYSPARPYRLRHRAGALTLSSGGNGHARARRYSVASIEPVPHVPAGPGEEPAGPALAASPAAAPEGVPAPEPATSREGLRGYFAIRGLPFMLDRPAAAIKRLAAGLLRGLLFVVAAPAVLFGIIFVAAVWDAAPVVGRTDKITHRVNTWPRVIADSRDVAFIVVALVVLVVLFFIVQSARRTVLEWSRVGNSMAVMLGFVALSFFTADFWRVAGAIPWWRLNTLIVVFSLLAYLVLYRQASRAVRDELKQPVSTEKVADAVRDPLVKKMVAETPELADAPRIPRHALVNLRLIAAVLLARRILISGIVVSVALFLLGLIVLGQQDVLTLMNAKSVTALGFAHTFGIGHYQFFLSESLLKVSLLLGVIAAGYFVFANPDPGQSHDLQVPQFIRRMIVLWVCYQDLRQAPADPA